MLTSPALKESVIFKSREAWVDVCPARNILPFTGVAALIEGEQVAIFRLADESECYAISNYDPFSKAYVLSRGLVGDKNGVVKVASPIYKNTFNLMTGQCLEDENIWLRTWTARVTAGIVQIAI
jgi:nitrite reductase (NADH) small subunit